MNNDWKDGYEAGVERGYRHGTTTLSRGWFVITLLVWTCLGFAGGVAAPKWFPAVAQLLDLETKELYPHGIENPDQ